MAPISQAHENKAAVGSHAVGEQAESSCGGDIVHFGTLPDNLFHLPGDHVRPLEGGRIRQLHIDHEVTHILLGQEPPRKKFTRGAGGDHHNSDKKYPPHHFAGENFGPFHIAIRRPIEHFVKEAEEKPQRATVWFGFLSSSEHSAGLRVNAFIEENITDTAMVMAELLV